MERFLPTWWNTCLQPVTQNQNNKSCTVAMLVTREVGPPDKAHQCGRDRISPPTQHVLGPLIPLPPNRDKRLTYPLSGIGGAGPSSSGAYHIHTLATWNTEEQMIILKTPKIGSVRLHAFILHRKPFERVTKILFL